MKLLNHTTTDGVREETYTFEDEVGVVIYKEWVNEKNIVIDEELRDKDGNSLDDPELLERVHYEVGAMNKKSGYTLIELMVCIAIVGVLAVGIGILYAIFHFVMKFW